jgi:hypothetical protein
MIEEAQEFLRYFFVKPTRWQRFRAFIRRHIPRRRKRFEWKPGMKITLDDGSTQTIYQVQDTTIKVTRVDDAHTAGD